MEMGDASPFGGADHGRRGQVWSSLLERKKRSIHPCLVACIIKINQILGFRVDRAVRQPIDHPWSSAPALIRIAYCESGTRTEPASIPFDVPARA
jgi:hypothetical protein